MSNNITITYETGQHHVVTDPVFQGDYGRQITFAGIADLPEAFEVHFSNSPSKGISTRSIGMNSVVDIPNLYLQTGEAVYGWVFLHNPEESGEAEYTFRIPVNRKPTTEPVVPTQPQDDVIAQAINALNNAAGKIPDIPAATPDGTYVLKCIVVSGVPTYSWVAEI